MFSFFDAIARPELKSDPRFATVAARFANVSEFFALRAKALAARPSAEWVSIFDAHDVPAMAYHTLDSVLDDPHLEDAGFFEMKQHPTEGRIRNMRLPNRWSSQMRDDWVPAPKLGQDSVAVLAEAGLDADAIAAMIASGATIDGRAQGKE